MKAIHKVALTIMMALALLVGIQSVSHADDYLKLVLSDGATTINVLDNGAYDLNPAVGKITFDGAVGTNWTANLTGAITYPIVGTNATPDLDLVTQDVTSLGGGTLTVKVSATGFTAAPAGSEFKIGGTAQNGVTAAAYSGADSYFSLDNQIGSSFIFTAGSFSGTTFGPVPDTYIPYSLSIVTDIVHTGAGASSFNAEVTVVPEPATLVFLGLGLFGAALYGRKKEKQ
jgi:hypothetical protein